MAYENIDQAVVEFEAKLGYDILSLSWEANMNKLPKTENAILLIPCHAYLYTDHSKKKGAITHRAETNGEYEVSSNYFTDCTGYDSHITVAKNQWRERRIELLTDLNKFKGWVKDTDDNWKLLGECSNVTENEIIHVDFMTEIQYNVMDLPAFDWTYNKQILNYVKTNQGWLRPSECLTKRGEQQGTYARIWWGVDDWGRFWFYHWIEK